jgi:hypothetical protein
MQKISINKSENIGFKLSGDYQYIWVPSDNINQSKRYYLLDTRNIGIFDENNVLHKGTKLLPNKDLSFLPVPKKCGLVRNYFLIENRIPEFVRNSNNIIKNKFMNLIKKYYGNKAELKTCQKGTLTGNVNKEISQIEYLDNLTYGLGVFIIIEKEIDFRKIYFPFSNFFIDNANTSGYIYAPIVKLPKKSDLSEKEYPNIYELQKELKLTKEELTLVHLDALAYVYEEVWDDFDADFNEVYKENKNDVEMKYLEYCKKNNIKYEKFTLNTNADNFRRSILLEYYQSNPKYPLEAPSFRMITILNAMIVRSSPKNYKQPEEYFKWKYLLGSEKEILYLNNIQVNYEIALGAKIFKQKAETS